MRPAREADAARLARVQVASWRCGYAGIVPDALLAELTGDEAETVWRDRWREAITNPPTSRHRVLVAVEQVPPRAVVGFVSAGPATDADRWPGTDGELYELRVAPEQTGHGHGSRLLHAAADTLVQDGFHTVAMWVLTADSALRRFLESAGWAADGARGELDVGATVPTLRLHAAIGELPARGQPRPMAPTGQLLVVQSPVHQDHGYYLCVAGFREWVDGTRPRTLPAAVVPVLIGSGVAAGYDRFSWWRAALALVVALALQVGVNYANDYSDGVRGSDAKRVGPVRLVAAGLAPPRQVRAAAFGCFGVAGAAGLALAAVTSWWLVAVGVASIAAAWFYTGGLRPYGYHGLGEVFVFVFFGVVAVAGTAYVQMGRLSWLGLAASVPAGLLACALLMVNNLRDIRTDTLAGKRTLAVRLGDARSRVTYVLMVLLPFCIAALLAFFRPFTLITALTLPLARIPIRSVRAGASGPALIKTLGQTGRLQLAFGIAFAIGLAIHL